MLTLLREMLHSPVLDIVQRLKHSTGMTVTELCTAMKMSYMGVKQHCVELEKAGFLDTWRRPKAAGRPEKLYRLTAKADALFLNCGPPLTLDLLGLEPDQAGLLWDKLGEVTGQAGPGFLERWEDWGPQLRELAQLPLLLIAALGSQALSLPS